MVVTDKSEIIIDASVLLAWLLPDEIYKPSANNVLGLYRNNVFSFLAPALLPYETVNGIVSSVKRKRITEAQAKDAIKLFQGIDIELIELDVLKVMEYSVKYNMSAYDGSYGYMLSSQNAGFITCDKKLFNIVKEIEKNIQWIEDFS